MPIEYILLGVSLLLILSVVASKVTDRFGIPALLLFLGLGMLAGSEGIGGIYFDDPALAQYVGIVSLVMILFAGGMETPIESVRPVIRRGVLLSTLGVVITATGPGCFFPMDPRLYPAAGFAAGGDRFFYRCSSRLLDLELKGCFVEGTPGSAVGIGIWKQ
jgi:NhaP-type Na+/H+ or K+/H+ antiporter